MGKIVDNRDSRQMGGRELGAVATFREAATILRTHFRFFSLIQLSLILPLVILLLAWASHQGQHLFDSAQVFLPRNIGSPDQLPSNADPKVTITLGGAFGAVIFVIFLMFFTAFTAVLIFVLQAVLSLSSSAILHSVGLHYSGRRVSFVEVLRAVVPNLWMRLTVTKTICTLLWSLSIVVVITPAILLQSVAPGWILLLFIVPFLISVFLFCIVKPPAGCVSVLEREYGWAAVKRARSLLRGRLGAAARLQGLWLLLTIVLGAIELLFDYQVASGGNALLQLISAALYGYCRVQYWTLYELCAGVQYASFRAYHNEDLTESLPYFGGYEKVLDDLAHYEGESPV